MQKLEISEMHAHTVLLNMFFETSQDVAISNAEIQLAINRTKFLFDPARQALEVATQKALRIRKPKR